MDFVNKMINNILYEPDLLNRFAAVRAQAAQDKYQNKLSDILMQGRPSNG